MIFGYMRISTKKESQTTDRQKLTLKNYAKENSFEFDEIVEERISGTIKAENREEYSNLKDKLRKDDVLVITDLDRLGRNADDVIMELKKLKAKGIRVVALDMPYMSDWNKANDNSIYEMVIDIVITIKAHMAQQEREKTVSRINQGLAVAKANGTKLGRPKAELPDNFKKEYENFEAGKYGKMTAAGFAKMLGIGRSTFYKYVKIYNEENS
ncbi:recombinase family protein [Clostridium brassicae]|uniref:Recombinase family protein n=1 Tax=Clostridium brassicae TaxID=2999072 RepID=A0ABT4D964_9CLOT|nr:recombinase family protein [Clostridium brassicae]MCY6958852.1 recombinase family protein [Clostridium brassicae]